MNYDTIDYDVIVDHQKKFFIKPGESWHYWLKITLVTIVSLPGPEIEDCYLKDIFS